MVITRKNIMAEHTKGPWKISHVDCVPKGHVAIDAPGHLSFAMVVWQMEDDEEPTPECVANANLIISAPDLLKSLKRFVDTLGEGWCGNPMLEQAKAAIAKAEGNV